MVLYKKTSFFCTYITLSAEKYGAFNKTEECVRARVESMDEGQQQLLCESGSCLCLLYASRQLLAFPLTFGFFSHWILNLGIHPTFISKPLAYLQKLNSHFQNSFDSMLGSLAWMPSVSQIFVPETCSDAHTLPSEWPHGAGLSATPQCLTSDLTHILCSSKLGLFKKYMTPCFSTCVPQFISFFFLCRMSNLFFFNEINISGNHSITSFSMIFPVERHFSPSICTG